MSLEERVREQGEKVRRLKAEKAPKEQVGCEENNSNIGASGGGRVLKSMVRTGVNE